MAEVIGPQTVLNMALPTGVDGTRIAQWKLRDGITYGELVNQVALALGDFNADLSRKWGWCFGLTEEPFMEYPDGGAVTAAPDITDLDKPDSIQGTTLGHMLDLRVYGRGIGGTRRYFRDARSARIRAAISALVNQLRWRFEQKLLTRWLTNTENAIGSAGYDVPFVRGTGGSVDFAPPAIEGEAFTTSHDHYLGVNSASLGFDDLLNTLAETVQEHGHADPFRAVVSRADIASYAVLTKFVEIVDPRIVMIDQGGATSGATRFARGGRDFNHFGDFQSDYGLIELWATSRLTTGYAGLTKPYGTLDERNGLAVRVHPDSGFGAYVVPETVPDDDYPIKQLNVEMEYGVSVGMDRTNGAAGLLVSGGAWANPTIS
jgi:hypothetical protein